MRAPSLVTGLDHLVVAVRDLAEAETAYRVVLGLEPSWRGMHPAYGTCNVLFAFADCYLELLAPGSGSPSHALALALHAYLAHRPEGLFALALGTDDVARTATGLRNAGLTTGPVASGEARDGSGATRQWRSCVLPRAQTRGVTVVIIEHTGAPLPRARVVAGARGPVSGVDHVVLFSDDLEGAIGLWRDTLGIPERWRREFLERGTVNVGLRLGGVTLELVAPLGGGAGSRGERLWGAAYRVDDCDAAVARIRAASVPVTDTRAGLAPHTRVATVKWSKRVPTLLLERTARGGAGDGPRPATSAPRGTRPDRAAAPGAPLGNPRTPRTAPSCGD